MPIPKSPTEEKQRRCPSCGAEHIHRLTAIGGEPLYCS
jgi:ribosomal protein S27AE